MSVKIRFKKNKCRKEKENPNLEDAQRGVGEGCEHSSVNPSVLFLIPRTIYLSGSKTYICIYTSTEIRRFHESSFLTGFEGESPPEGLSFFISRMGPVERALGIRNLCKGFYFTLFTLGNLISVSVNVRFDPKHI